MTPDNPAVVLKPDTSDSTEILALRVDLPVVKLKSS
jgi:hypothetical protein